MYSIYLNYKNKGLGYEDFKDGMIDICNEHRNEGKAMAFAFIIYDFSNPQLAKIILDTEYWLALHHISGKYLTIFSFDYNPRDSEPLLMMTQISRSKNQSLSKSTNELVNKYFGDVTVEYPAVLFFQVDDNEVIDSLLISLKEEKIEDAFLELKEYIERAVVSLQRIEPENKGNVSEIFDCLEREVENAQLWRKVKRASKKGALLGLIATIRGAFGL